MTAWLEQIFMLEPWKSLLTFAGAILTAWFAVRLALGRYKSEKLWERKVGIYAEIIEALSTIERVSKARYDMQLDDYGNVIGDDQKSEATKRSEKRLNRLSSDAHGKANSAIAHATVFLGKTANIIIAEWTETSFSIATEVEHGQKDYAQAYNALADAARIAIDKLQADAILLIKNH